MNIRKACIVLFILVAAIVFVFSAQNGEVSNAISDSFSHVVRLEKVAPVFNTPSWQLWHLKLVLRKYAHVFLFGLMGAIGFLMWNPNKSIQIRGILTMIICCTIACFDELHQVFVPGRTASLKDIFIDLIGIAIGVGAVIAISFIRTQRNRKEQVERYDETK